MIIVRIVGKYQGTEQHTDQAYALRRARELHRDNPSHWIDVRREHADKPILTIAPTGAFAAEAPHPTQLEIDLSPVSE
jgi:hypothetical protein